MKVASILSFFIVVALVEATHTFLGTNVGRPVVFHYDASYNAQVFRKRIEYVNYTLPPLNNVHRVIQGILAYDLRNSGASANVTEGGVGTNYVKLRMKSDRGEKMHYDIYVYA